MFDFHKKTKPPNRTIRMLGDINIPVGEVEDPESVVMEDEVVAGFEGVMVELDLVMAAELAVEEAEVVPELAALIELE